MSSILVNNKKVGILFSGGPAPSANAVISSVALNLLDRSVGVIGIFKGYEYLQDFNKESPHLEKGVHYTEIDYSITKVRNNPGIFLRTSRANPGKNIKKMDDIHDSEKTRMLKNIIDAFEYLNIGAIISIGGDDTLKTANFIHLLGFPVIHIPKTIDNDYYGIPWTFGYWTAVDIAQKALLNLRADAQATDSFFIAELMGRKAGWITYAAGIAAEAIMMISPEDIQDDTLNFNEMSEKIADVLISRARDLKPYGVIAVSEGIVDKLPEEMKPTEKDKHGNLIYSEANISHLLAEKVKTIYTEKTGRDVKVVARQIGYETRSGSPIAFDVVLGSMLGHGAATFCLEERYGVMVSVTDNFDLKSVPFNELVDENTMLTKLRGVPRGSDLFVLKERLSYRNVCR